MIGGCEFFIPVLGYEMDMDYFVSEYFVKKTMVSCEYTMQLAFACKFSWAVLL